MKKKVIIINFIILVLGILAGGFLIIKNSKETLSNNDNKDILNYIYSMDITKEYLDIRNLPYNYDYKKALADKVYVNNYTGVYNEEIIEKFYESYKNNQECFMRLMKYTIEGDPIIVDVLFDKNKIYIVNDSRRDNFSSEKNITFKIFSKFGVEKDKDKYYWICYNSNSNLIESENYWVLALVSDNIINKIDKENLVFEKMSINKFYNINANENILHIEDLDQGYNLDSAKKDKCIIKDNNAFCGNMLDNFIKDINNKKDSFIRIISQNNNIIIIKDAYYDSDLDKIYLVVDKSRVINIPNEDKKIKMFEYDKINTYNIDDNIKVDLVVNDIRDDYYLCDCIWEETEVFNLL